MNQSDLADAIGVSLRTIQLYEKENANIPIKNLNKIANFFGMGIDQLYAHEVNEDNKGYTDINLDLKKAHAIKKLEPGKYLVLAPLLLGNQQLTYIKNIGNVDFVKGLPRIGFIVDQVSVAEYLAFEVLNDSMDSGLTNAIPQNTIVLGKKVSVKGIAEKIKAEDSFWVLVCKEYVMCKKITAFDKKTKTITCHSLNKSPEYPDFEILIDEVHAFYKIVKKQID